MRRNGLHPPSPLSRGHRDPSVVSAPAHAQRMGNKTLCEVCFDTPTPPSTHTILRATLFPRMLGIPLANLGLFCSSLSSLPVVCSSRWVSRLAVFRVGLCVMCGFLFEFSLFVLFFVFQKQ